MRLIFSYLLGLWLSMAAGTAIPSDEPDPGAWEVLEGCRLVKSPGNDGDSFKVLHTNEEFIIRLYYVDCPETYDTYKDRLKDQARYFSIPESDVIPSGKTAKAFTRQFLADTFTVITCWEDARGGEQKRYFGIVRKKDRLLSTELVCNGLARIYGMPTKDRWPDGFAPSVYLKKLKQHEHIARKTKTGIWGNHKPLHKTADLERITPFEKGAI